MKKLLLASAVAVLSITAVHAAPTVYGKAFLSLDVQDGNDAAKTNGDVETRTQLNSNASRIGFKGSERLSKEIDLLYQLEYGVDIDENNDQFYARDTYLGLAHKRFGTAVAGRLTAIDDYINYANVTKGGVVGGDNVLASIDGPRANNAFAYFSPSFNGLQFMGMYVLDENSDTKEVEKDVKNASGVVIGKITETVAGRDTFGRDAAGIGVKYEPNGAPYMGGLTYIQAGDTKAARLSGAYALNQQITLGALYQNTQWGKNHSVYGDKKENAFTVSGKYKIAQTPWTTYAQLDFVDNFAGYDAERQRLAVGGEYSFNKATTGHLYGAYLQDKAPNTQTEKVYGIGAGLEYKF